MMMMMMAAAVELMMGDNNNNGGGGALLKQLGKRREIDCTKRRYKMERQMQMKKSISKVLGKKSMIELPKHRTLPL